MPKVKKPERCDCGTTAKLYEYFHGWQMCYFCGVLWDLEGNKVDMTHFPYVCFFSPWDELAQARADWFIAAWESGLRGDQLVVPGGACDVRV